MCLAQTATQSLFALEQMLLPAWMSQVDFTLSEQTAGWSTCSLAIVHIARGPAGRVQVSSRGFSAIHIVLMGDDTQSPHTA